MKLYRNILLILVLFTNIILADSPYKWEQVASVNQYFMSVENIDSLNLMALANRNYAYKYLYHSTDGGFTWDTIYKDLERIQYGTDLAYPTKDFIIFTADAGFENDAGIYVRSTNGGITWDERRTNHYDTVLGYRDVRMYDDKHGVISGGYNMIVSHDGFDTWDSVKLPERFRIVKPEMISPYSIYAMVYTSSPYNQRFLSSKDGGLTWIEFPFPDPLPEFSGISNMKFLDSLFGYAIGWDRIGSGSTKSDRIFRTTDGGESWKLVLDTLMQVPPRYGLSNLDFLDRNHAIFVGQGGKIYWTHDGGNSFIFDLNEKVREKKPNTIYVSMLGVHTAVIVDGSGRILRSTLVTGVGEEEPPTVDCPLISPNPAGDYLNIFSAEDISHISIYNALGICVYSSSLNATSVVEGNELRIDVSGFPSGVYFLRSSSGTVRRTEKFVINR